MVDPPPMEPVSCDNNEKATHDKDHHPEVKEENCVSEKLVRHGWYHLRHLIGIGRGFMTDSLPHHRAYG